MIASNDKYAEFRGAMVPFRASAPGETLADELEERGIEPVDFANAVGVSLEFFNELIEGKHPVTEELAKKFEEILKINADFWLRRQLFYEYSLLVIAEREASQVKRPIINRPNFKKRRVAVL